MKLSTSKKQLESLAVCPSAGGQHAANPPTSNDAGGTTKDKAMANNKVSLVVSTRDAINLAHYLASKTVGGGKIGETIVIDFKVTESEKNGHPMIHSHECEDASNGRCPFNATL